MAATSIGRHLINKSIGIFDKVIEKRQHVMPPQTVDALDALQDEISRIEQALADVATRPSRVVRKPNLGEPVTEQQKIIDLAG